MVRINKLEGNSVSPVNTYSSPPDTRRGVSPQPDELIYPFLRNQVEHEIRHDGYDLIYPQDLSLELMIATVMNHCTITRNRWEQDRQHIFIEPGHCLHYDTIWTEPVYFEAIGSHVFSPGQAVAGFTLMLLMDGDHRSEPNFITLLLV